MRCSCRPSAVRNTGRSHVQNTRLIPETPTRRQGAYTSQTPCPMAASNKQTRLTSSSSTRTWVGPFALTISHSKPSRYLSTWAGYNMHGGVGIVFLEVVWRQKETFRCVLAVFSRKNAEQTSCYLPHVDPCDTRILYFNGGASRSPQNSTNSLATPPQFFRISALKSYPKRSVQ